MQERGLIHSRTRGAVAAAQQRRPPHLSASETRSHLCQGAIAEAEEVDIPLVQRLVVLELEGKPELLGVGAHEPRQVSHQTRVRATGFVK